MSNLLLRLTLFTFVLGLTGCAVSPPVIDVSDSKFTPKVADEAGHRKLAAVRVVNQADDGKGTTAYISDSYVPIKPATTTKETVESDIKQFFAESFRLDPSAPKSLVVTISKADSYFVWSGASKIPFVGIAVLSLADTEFCMNLRVLLEVEQNGKVISSYLFDEKITIQGQNALQESFIQSYRRLIAEYRRRFFGELETKFINRYF